MNDFGCYRKEIIDISENNIDRLIEKVKNEILLKENDGWRVDSTCQYTDKKSLFPYHFVYTISKFEK